MGYKTSYTGAGMDEIFNKSKSFKVNDASWMVIPSSITTLDISKVLRSGNYIYSGKLNIPEMDQLYGFNTSTSQVTTTLTGSYMIFVRMINYNIYQMISAHSIYENNSNMIIIAWIRQADYTYIPKIYHNNEPSNTMFAFADSVTNDKGIHKYPNQLRKFSNAENIQYYDKISASYKNLICTGGMSTAIYGSINDVFNYIDQHLTIGTNMHDHVNNDTIHITSSEKANYDSKATSDSINTLYNNLNTAFLKELEAKISVVAKSITASEQTLQAVQNTLTTHIDDSVKHPSNNMITNWNSKSNKNHTHTKDDITISTDHVIGIIDPTNIPKEAKEIQVTVSTKNQLLNLTKTDIHNGCWVLVKSSASNSISYYVVIDDTKLGTMDAFQQLNNNPYSSTDLVWSNVKNKPTTITQICDDVITNSAVDELVHTTNTKSATTETNINSALGKISPLNTRDNSFIMENLIDLIDYKMQIIRSLISNM